ncbi:hypothetical protein HDU90_003613 [Geranomyces variabilis]|nr:hypothetical protein HDU90_003613 [Geranomyces variabilis]
MRANDLEIFIKSEVNIITAIGAHNAVCAAEGRPCVDPPPADWLVKNNAAATPLSTTSAKQRSGGDINRDEVRIKREPTEWDIDNQAFTRELLEWEVESESGSSSGGRNDKIKQERSESGAIAKTSNVSTRTRPPNPFAFPPPPPPPPPSPPRISAPTTAPVRPVVAAISTARPPATQNQTAQPTTVQPRPSTNRKQQRHPTTFTSQKRPASTQRYGSTHRRRPTPRPRPRPRASPPPIDPVVKQALGWGAVVHEKHVIAAWPPLPVDYVATDPYRDELARIAAEKKAQRGQRHW